MATTQVTSFSVIDSIKRDVGDPDNDYFSDDEYESFIRRHIDSINWNEIDARRVEDQDFYKVNALPPFWKLQVKNPPTDSDWEIDEWSGILTRTDQSPSGDDLRVQFHDVCYSDIMSDIFLAIASDESKFAIRQNAAGHSFDQKELKRHLKDSAVEWRNRDDVR